MASITSQLFALPPEYKKNLYVTHVLGTVLFGCESWSIGFKEKTALQVFHHKSLRKILNINMWQVKRERIRNLHIRERMKIHNITDYITKRQLGWLNQLGKLYLDKFQNETTKERETFHVSKLLFAWVNTPNPCKPQRTARRDYKDALMKIFEDNDRIAKNGSFNEWRESIECNRFKERIDYFWQRTKPGQNETETETEN